MQVPFLEQSGHLDPSQLSKLDFKEVRTVGFSCSYGCCSAVMMCCRVFYFLAKWNPLIRSWVAGAVRFPPPSLCCLAVHHFFTELLPQSGSWKHSPSFVVLVLYAETSAELLLLAILHLSCMTFYYHFP